jgi:hypothetical protein
MVPVFLESMSESIAVMCLSPVKRVAPADPALRQYVSYLF